MMTPKNRGSRWIRMAMGLSFMAAMWACSVATAQDTAGRFYDLVHHGDDGDHRYVVFVPAGYRPNVPSPAILFLHGAGERGNDNRLQLTVGLAPYIQARARTFPFLAIFPQCPLSDTRILGTWSPESPGGRQAMNILDDARKHYNFDPKRVVLTGWSMGGYGCWSLGIAESSRWSAILPLSGGGDPAQIAALKDVPVWAFHGAKDKLINAEAGRAMVDALNNAGGKATYTELPDGAHDISDEVYGNDAVIAWMLNPAKAPSQLGSATVKAVAAINVPFVPALEIPSAAGLRLGNEVLDAISYSIPQSISPDMLSGRLNDMFDSTVASGRQFSIRFSGITYHGRLDRVVAKAQKDRVLVQMGIRDVQITIGGTSVTGARHSAQAGPIAIRIGFRYPVWFNLELSPYIADRQIRLRLIGAGFQIPGDNWSVSAPSGVSVQGFGMTQEAVVSGLTNGLYGARSRIENEVLSIAPRIVQEIEKNLMLPNSASPLSQSGTTIAKLWPLPMYPPRFQTWPEAISVDENGISLVVGVTVGSLNPFGPSKPVKRSTASNISLGQLPADKLLHVVVAPNVLEPITELYVDSQQTQLDLRDVPEPLFGKLADRSTLQEIIPDLAQYGDSLKVRSSLRVVRPMQVGEAKQPATTEGPKPLEFDLPSTQIVISIKKDGQQADWQQCAEFDLKLSEQLQARLEKPAHDQRVVNLDWLPATNVTGSGRFVEGYQAKNSTLQTDRYIKLLNDAWKSYFEKLKGTQTEVPDLTIGMSKLRISDLKWESPTIEVSYRLAQIKLSNSSNEVFTYQTKAPAGAWGKPLTLKPGASHEFEIPYPLTYMRNTPSGTEVYTLPVGSHSEFRVPTAGGSPRLFAAKRT